MESGNHAIFERHSPVVPDPKQREFRAAARFGYIVDTTGTAGNNWLDLPREARAVMTAFDILESYTNAVSNEDGNAVARRKAEARAAASKLKGGKG